MIEEIAEMGRYIDDDMAYNYEKWSFLGKRQQKEPDAIVALTAYSEHVDYLTKWMRDRKQWLDNAFAN